MLRRGLRMRGSSMLGVVHRRLLAALPLAGCTLSVSVHAELEGSSGAGGSSSSSSTDASSERGSSSEGSSSQGADESSDDGSTGDDPPAGPARYPSDVVHSPIDAHVAARMLEVREAGPELADDVFMKVGASSDVATASLHCFATDAPMLGAHEELADVLALFLGGDADGTSPFDRESLATEAGRSAGWVIDGDPSPLQAELDAIAPALAFVHFGTNDMQLGIDPGAALPGFHVAMAELLDTLELQGVVPIVVGLTKRADDADADRWIPAYNAVLRGMAQARQVPFLDVWRAVDPLANHGLGPDGLHLEAYADGACVLDDQGLAHGYNVRNLVQLEALARVDAALAEAPPGGEVLAPLEGAGTHDEPWSIDGLPFIHDADTSAGTMQIDAYACSDADEAGPELVYELTLAQATAVRVIALDREGVDVDVHVIAGDDPATCLARADTTIATTLDPGTWTIVVDTWADGELQYPGAYQLAVVPCDDDDPACAG